MTFDWDPKKNEILKSTRNVSFEAVVVHLGRGDLWRIADHPDQARYSGQRIFFVVIDDYIHLVPFEVRRGVMWLITIIPNRKATDKYRKEQEK